MKDSLERPLFIISEHRPISTNELILEGLITISPYGLD